MTKVTLCAADWCSYYKDGKCTLEEIGINVEGECDSQQLESG